MAKKYDFLVIGSGIAGLSYVAKLAAHFEDKQQSVKIAILTKSVAEESNTKYAQGGIAAVWNEGDSFSKHIEDTMVAGDFLSDREVVEIVVSEAPERLKELISYGTNFDKNKNGEFDLVKEGGHSDFRILHHKDSTGNEIERALLEKVKSYESVDFFTHYFAIDIITQHHLGVKVTKDTPEKKCFGAYVLNTKNGNVETFLSKTTLLATGGIGNIYQSTTNPTIATGDGIAMAYRAKAQVEGMQFIQFHPTSLYQPSRKPSFLISEAVRGHGGVLKRKDGTTFMELYDERLSLAPRDIVARAIDSEMKTNGVDHVYLDTRHLEKNDFFHHFPMIYNYCKDKLSIDITGNDMIPVVPAQHYLCGGIKVNVYAQTNIDYLFAAGECSATGLHGANRLASNSLLEAIVYAHRAFVKSVELYNENVIPENIPDWNQDGTTNPEEQILVTEMTRELESIMSNYVGIVRTDRRLKRAFDRLELIYLEHEELYRQSKVSLDICELRNMINVAYLVIKQAIAQKENRGLHYNLDNFTR
ncbi:MAG: L-aspartate oxidase [Pseudarcicella sp.]|nr:L-aspartate oxidase [Pseudarcicella sp.]MBP6410524.1 L-aspartate oxidase [Pseudarcicella sp.]